MARYIELHPTDPQPRAIAQTVALLRDEDALIAYPTDSCYALGARLSSVTGPERIRQIRHLDAKHDFTLVCSDFHQLGALVHLDNSAFRAIKAATPGAYTFILPATKEVPKRLHHPKKKTVGVRIPEHTITQAIVRELGEPLLCSTLILPGKNDPLIYGEDVAEAVGNQVDLVVDAPVGEGGATTVVSFEQGYPEVVREGAGDTSLFN